MQKIHFTKENILEIPLIEENLVVFLLPKKFYINHELEIKIEHGLIYIYI